MRVSGQPAAPRLESSACQVEEAQGQGVPQKQQESLLGILTGHSDPPHPYVSQMLARSSIYNTNRRDEKCDCVTRYFYDSVTG